MRQSGARQVTPELKGLVVEASQALARLDVERLEELAICCRALNRSDALLSPEQRRELARQAREAAGDMAVFARVLKATRANLKVMNRLREMRTPRLEYTEQSAVVTRVCAETESGHGNH